MVSHHRSARLPASSPGAPLVMGPGRGLCFQQEGRLRGGQETRFLMDPPVSPSAFPSLQGAGGLSVDNA